MILHTGACVVLLLFIVVVYILLLFAVSTLEDYHSNKASGGSSHAEPISLPSMPSALPRQQYYPPNVHILTPPHHPTPSQHPMAHPVDGVRDMPPFNAAMINRTTSGEPTPSQESTVESWEDMAVEESSVSTGSSAQEKPPAVASTKSLSTGVDDPRESPPLSSTTGLGKDSQGRLEVKSSVEEVTASPSSAAAGVGGGGNGHGGSSSRKNHSPCPSKSSKIDTAKAAQLAQHPSKENLNVIFIGHVGEYAFVSL